MQTIVNRCIQLEVGSCMVDLRVFGKSVERGGGGLSTS